MASDLWLDQPDAHSRIDLRAGRGELEAEQAEKLHGFVDQGFMAVRLECPDSLFEQFEKDVDQVWKEKPVDLAYAHSGGLTSMADSDEASERTPSYRIADLHSHSPAALDLYLNRQILEWVELLFGEPCVAFQSLYFQFGSRQSLHRDPVYVVTKPPSHLLAAWIALEDIGPDCGPLCYVPGSHRLPYYEFSPGRIAIRAGEDYLPAYEFTRRQCEERGLGEQLLTCRRGDAFLWHASLVHGGSPVNDPQKTRRSFVVHYSTRANYLERSGSYSKSVQVGKNRPPEVRQFWAGTRNLLERDGLAGFDNPLRGLDPQRDLRRQAARGFLKKLKAKIVGS